MADWITGKIEIKVGDYPLEMEMTVPAGPVKPQRMLPVFQQISNSIVGISEDAIRDAGKEISCKAGCGACCRQPVPISESEVYQLAALVDEMPEPRRSVIRERFRIANEHFRSIGWYDRIAGIRARRGDESWMKDLHAESMLYFHEQVACPFLENESCSIHTVRPLVCREYLVTSPAENCKSPTADSIDKVPLLMKPSTAGLHVGATGRLSKWGVIPLIRALEFADEFPESFAEKPGPAWAAEFFEHLTHSQVPGSEPGQSTTKHKKPRLKKRKK